MPIVSTGCALPARSKRHEPVAVDLHSEEIEVRRVPVNRDLDAPVAVRYEGETMIVPVVEEVLIVKKQLRLKEEIHIIRKQTVQRHQEEVLLRREEVIVEPVR